MMHFLVSNCSVQHLAHMVNSFCLKHTCAVPHGDVKQKHYSRVVGPMTIENVVEYTQLMWCCGVGCGCVSTGQIPTPYVKPCTPEAAQWGGTGPVTTFIS